MEDKFGLLFMRFSAKGWGWSFHAALQKKTGKTARHPPLWGGCLVVHCTFGISSVQSFVQSLKNYALCIENYVLSVVRNYQMMVRSFSSSHILAPGLMSKALKKVSMLRRVALTRYSPSECGSLLVCM